MKTKIWGYNSALLILLEREFGRFTVYSFSEQIFVESLLFDTLFYLLRIWQQTKRPLPQGYYILVQKADYMQINEQKVLYLYNMQYTYKK